MTEALSRFRGIVTTWQLASVEDNLPGLIQDAREDGFEDEDIRIALQEMIERSFKESN